MSERTCHIVYYNIEIVKKFESCSIWRRKTAGFLANIRKNAEFCSWLLLMYNHKRCQTVLLRTNNNHSNSKLIVALTRPVWRILTSSTLRSHVSGVRPQGSLNS